DRAALNVVDRRLATHQDFQIALVKCSPAVSVSILRGISGMKLLAIEVACGGGVVGHAPGDRPVGAAPQARYSRMTGASRGILRAVHRVFVPAGGDPERLVRIAAQQRVPRGGPMRRNSPVVTPAVVAHSEQAWLEWALAQTRGVGIGGVGWEDA